MRLVRPYFGWLVLGCVFILGGFWKLIPGLINHFYRADGYTFLHQALEILGDEISEPDFCVEGGVTNPQALNLVVQAVGVLEKARQARPTDAQTLLLLGRAYCLAGKLEEAIAAYEGYSALRPGSPLGWLEGGFAYEEENDTTQTFLLWQKAGITYTHFIESGEMYQKAKHFKIAEVQYIRAETTGADLESSRWYLQFLSLEARDGETASAYEALRQAITHDHGWANDNYRKLAWFKWGVWSYTQGNFEEAITALEKAIDLASEKIENEPQLSETYRFLGLAYWEVNKKALAIESLAQAVNLNPGNIWAHIHYGKLLYLSEPGQLSKSAEEFARALDIQPDNITYWLTTIKFWNWVGETDQAQILCKQALVKWETDAELITQCKTAVSP